MALFPSWRRHLVAPSVACVSPPLRFDSALAVPIGGPDELASLSPGFVRALSAQFQVQALAARLCPVLLDDQSVAIFALAEHVGSDQADELARQITAMGYVLAHPQRYVLAAPLLLAIARNQVTAQSLSGQPGQRLAQSTTALADAFNDLIEWGVRNEASDLHLNVRLNAPESEVKYTLSGRYLSPERFRRMPTSMLVDMLSVAWMDIVGGNGALFDPTIEQQGSMTRLVDGQEIMLRWASLAADCGPSVCLRLLKRDVGASLPALDELGYLPDQAALIKRVMLSEGGAIVFAGTVGSGKSTTLASLIAGVAPYRKVVTIEDPVEYVIPGAIQNTVARNLDAAAYQDYAAKLRALKRSAMSDVLLGEIRDQETGLAFMDLASSGVSVYTTVHAPSARLIPQRLASDFIGVSRDFLATPGMLKLLVFQALLPVLCSHCALPAYSLAESGAQSGPATCSGQQWRMWLNLIQDLYACPAQALRVRNTLGCPACRRPQLPELNGYAGRTVVAETIEPALQPAFLQSLQRGGMHTGVDPDPLADGAGAIRSAMECAVIKAGHGLIDPRDIEQRFHAFETERRLRDACSVIKPVVPALRAAS